DEGERQSLHERASDVELRRGETVRPLAAAIADTLNEDGHVQNEPEQVAVQLGWIVRPYERKDELPGNVRGRGRDGHRVRLIPSAAADDEDIRRHPAHIAAGEKKTRRHKGRS